MREMSKARLAANRANARLSTGPRTEEGKKRSAQNAVRHGLFGRAAVLEGEERQVYLDFTGALIDSLAPETAMERQLAERVADQEWRLARIEAITEAMMAPGGDAEEPEEPDRPAGLSHVYAWAGEFRERPEGMATLSIYEQRLARMAREARKELREMQAARQTREANQMMEAIRFYKLHKMMEIPWMPEEYGFVFSTWRMEQEIFRRNMRYASLVASTYDYDREKWKKAHPKREAKEGGSAQVNRAEAKSTQAGRPMPLQNQAEDAVSAKREPPGVGEAS